jgi:hypothetical protein
VKSQTGLSSFLVSILCAEFALAEPPVAPATDAQRAASALVDSQLLDPLKKAESGRNRFSRVASVAVERRLRALDQVAQSDLHGKQFVRFAVDVRHPWDAAESWQQDAVLGCAYLQERLVFVRRGETYVPADTLLGKDGTAAPDVCRSASEGGGQRSGGADYRVRPTVRPDPSPR